MIIYPATDADKLRTLPLLREVIRAGETYPYDPQSSDNQLLALWFNERQKTYVAEQDGAIVGTYYIRPNQPHLGDHVCNAGFMVASRYAGKGIGTALGEHALKEAKALGYRAMQFNLVVETNIASIRIWEKLGFTTIGIVPEAFRHSTHGLVGARVMHKKLRATTAA